MFLIISSQDGIRTHNLDDISILRSPLRHLTKFAKIYGVAPQPIQPKDFAQKGYYPLRTFPNC